MKSLKLLDAHLATHSHLVGSRTTIADYAIGASLNYPMRFLFEENARKNFANVTKWFEALTADSAFITAFGKVRLCVTKL